MTRYDNNIVIPERTTPLHVIPDGRQADPESIPGCPSQSSMGWKRPGFRIIAKAISGMTAYVAALGLAALFAPQAALAQCAPPTGTEAVPAPASGTVTCQPGDYADGIYYDSIGDLTLEVPDDTVDLTVNADGVNVTGNLTDSVFWDSSAFVSGDIIGTGGAVLDYSSVTGAIGITAGGNVFGNGSATHGIRAVSDSGSIDITTNGQVTGDEFGIQAETGGSAALTINANSGVNVDGSAGVAAIDATTGTGLLTINIDAGGSSADEIDGEAGASIRAEAGGDLDINVLSGAVQVLFAGGVPLDLTAAGTTTVTIGDDGRVGDFHASRQGLVAIRAAGGDFTLHNNNNGTGLQGSLDFSGLSGTATVNNSVGSLWATSGISDFGPGTGEVNNAGRLRLDTSNANDPSLTTFTGLESFNNSGEIDFAGGGNEGTFTGDRLSMPGATFTGLDGSVLLMDANLEGPRQLDCEDTAIADCLILTGGETAGQTVIRLVVQEDPEAPFAKAIGPGINAGVVLVDVGGGVSQAGHFVLHPDSFARIDRNLTTVGGAEIENVPVYAEDPVYGAVLETGGIFDYTLLYNPGTQQHLLASVPRKEAVEYAAFPHEALSIWHTTADTVAGRQADLRDGATGGGWARIVSESTERGTAPTLTTHGNDFTYDSGYKLNTRSLIVGHDLTDADDYAMGLHIGLVSARQEYDGTSSRDETRGATLGAYAGWWNDAGLTLDGTINANVLTINHSPANGFEHSDNDVRSLGVRAEAGWRMPLAGESFYVQPLATAAYVRADIEGLDLRHQEADFENADSQRAALGLRLGGDVKLTGDQFSRIKYWLTARAWEEFAGDDAHVAFKVEGGEDMAIRDDLSGSFEEVGLGASLTNADGNVSVFVSGNLRSGDDTDSENVTVGARINW